MGNHFHVPGVIHVNEANKYLECPEKHLLSYKLRRLPIARPKALEFGTAFHQGLAAFLLREPSPKHPTGVLDEYDLATLEALLVGYSVRYENADKVLGVEVPFTCGIGDGVELHGTIDALVERDGRVWVMEHKTASVPIGIGSNYHMRLAIDSQVSAYMLGAQALGYHPAGCIYDVVAKPRISPIRATPIEKRKYTQNGRLYANQYAKDETLVEWQERLVRYISENVDDTYVRYEVSRTQKELRLLQEELAGVHEMISLGMHPRNTHACFNWNRPCEYFDVCSGVADIEDNTRFCDYVEE